MATQAELADDRRRRRCKRHGFPEALHATTASPATHVVSEWQYIREDLRYCFTRLGSPSKVCEISASRSTSDDAESERAIVDLEADPFSKDYKQTILLEYQPHFNLSRGTYCIPSITVLESAHLRSQASHSNNISCLRTSISRLLSFLRFT
jgi:hypothetical protein